MKNLLFFLIMASTLLGCKSPEARLPVIVNSGSFIKESVERNKALNKTERKIKSLLDSGKSAKDIINPEKEGMSKANVHKTINKLKGEKDGVDKQTIDGKTKEIF